MRIARERDGRTCTAGKRLGGQGFWEFFILHRRFPGTDDSKIPYLVSIGRK